MLNILLIYDPCYYNYFIQQNYNLVLQKVKINISNFLLLRWGFLLPLKT